MNGVHEMFDKLRKLFDSKSAKKTVADPKSKAKRKSEKELATERGEAWVSVVSVELDPEDVGNGAFELDWNDKFLAQLIRAGYQVRANEPENEIVDRWFATVCRNIAFETYQQEMADPENRSRVERRDIGNGRSELG